MRSHRLRMVAGFMLGSGLCLFSAACSREQKVSAVSVEPSKVRVEEAPDANVVEVDHPDQFKLATVEVRKADDQLQVTGAVAPDVNRSVPVISMTSGRVVSIRARLGDDVQKGQVLLELSSPDVSQAFSDYAKFQADELLAHRQLERAQLLYSKGAIAQKDVQVAEDTDEKAKVDVKNAIERIKIVGADIAHPSPVIEIRAPISGTIVEQNTTSGTGVKSLDNSPNLFTIADLSQVWILCDVYENDLAKVHIGDSADVRLNAYPERPLRGRVSNIGSVLDPATRTVKVRLELANPGRMLRPNMFASVTFHAKGSKQRAVVPVAALLQLHDKSWVFRPEGGKRFRRVEVQAGASTSDGFQEILAGLSEGDKIVANALQFSSVVEGNQ